MAWHQVVLFSTQFISGLEISAHFTVVFSYILNYNKWSRNWTCLLANSLNQPWIGWMFSSSSQRDDHFLFNPRKKKSTWGFHSTWNSPQRFYKCLYDSGIKKVGNGSGLIICMLSDSGESIITSHLLFSHFLLRRLEEPATYASVHLLHRPHFDKMSHLRVNDQFTLFPPWLCGSGGKGERERNPNLRQVSFPQINFPTDKSWLYEALVCK